MSSALRTLEDKDISLTPLGLIRSLGSFDLDCCGLKAHPTSARIIQLPEDGLTQKWEGRVWCNPPYSEPEPWMKKMASHQNGVALVLASTGTRWFQEFCFSAKGIMFLAKRPKFTRMDGSAFSIMRDCALIAFSANDLASFYMAEVCGDLKGRIVSL